MFLTLPLIIYILQNLSFYNLFGVQVENVVVEIPMPKCVSNCSLLCNQGKYSFDPVSRLLSWDVGRIDVSKLPNLQGMVTFSRQFLDLILIYMQLINYLNVQKCCIFQNNNWIFEYVPIVTMWEVRDWNY